MTSLPHGHAYSDNGQPVPFAEFDFSAVDGEDVSGFTAADLARGRQEAVVGLLQFLTADGASAEVVGRKAILLSHMMRREGTQRALAIRLDLTPGRISQQLNALERQMSNVLGRSDAVSYQQN